MKTLLIALFSMFLFGCGNMPDFWIGPTKVYLEAGAEDQVPCDLFEGMRHIEGYFEKNHDKKIAYEIISKPLILYPDYAGPVEAFGRLGYYNGLTESGAIKVRILGPSILSTALIHEYVNHYACFILHKDVNASHENPECRQLEIDVGNYVQSKIAPLWESGRCSELDWR